MSTDASSSARSLSNSGDDVGISGGGSRSRPSRANDGCTASTVPPRAGGIRKLRARLARSESLEDSCPFLLSKDFARRPARRRVWRDGGTRKMSSFRPRSRRSPRISRWPSVWPPSSPSSADRPVPIPSSNSSRCYHLFRGESAPRSAFRRSDPPPSLSATRASFVGIGAALVVQAVLIRLALAEAAAKAADEFPGAVEIGTGTAGEDPLVAEKGEWDATGPNQQHHRGWLVLVWGANAPTPPEKPERGGAPSPRSPTASSNSRETEPPIPRRRVHRPGPSADVRLCSPLYSPGFKHPEGADSGTEDGVPGDRPGGGRPIGAGKEKRWWKRLPIVLSHPGARCQGSQGGVVLRAQRRRERGVGGGAVAGCLALAGHDGRGGALRGEGGVAALAGSRGSEAAAAERGRERRRRRRRGDRHCGGDGPSEDGDEAQRTLIDHLRACVAVKNSHEVSKTIDDEAFAAFDRASGNGPSDGRAGGRARGVRFRARGWLELGRRRRRRAQRRVHAHHLRHAALPGEDRGGAPGTPSSARASRISQSLSARFPSPGFTSGRTSRRFGRAAAAWRPPPTHRPRRRGTGHAGEPRALRRGGLEMDFAGTAEVVLRTNIDLNVYARDDARKGTNGRLRRRRR